MGYLETADRLFESGDVDGALEYYEKALEEDPADPVVWNNYGVALEEKNRVEEAMVAYRKAMEVDPAYGIAYLNLGNLLVRLGRFKEAEVAFREGIEKAPGEVGLYLELASLYFRKPSTANRGKWVLQRLLEMYPNDLDVLKGVAERLIEGGFPEDAIRIIDAAMEIYDDPDLLNLKGNAYLEMDMYAEAVQLYDEAIRKNPLNEEYWNNKGFGYLLLGLYEDAIECYDRALEINPDYRNAWYNKAYTYHAMQELAKAVFCYWKAIRLYPHDEVAWNNLGNALYNLGRYMESIPYFMKSVQINPGFETGWDNIGNALDRMGMHEISIPFHEMAIQINPKFDYAWYAKGMALIRLGRAEEALHYIDTSLKLNPMYDHAWIELGRALAMLSQWDDAINALKRAVEINPHSGEAYELMGDIYRRLGHYTRALSHYLKAVEAYRTAEEYMDADVRKHLVEVLIKAKRLWELENFTSFERAVLELLKEDEFHRLRDPEHISMAARVLISTGRYEDAAELLRRAEDDLKPGGRALLKALRGDLDFTDEELRSEEILTVAILLAECDRVKEALNLLERCTPYHRGKADYYYAMHLAHLRAGNVKEARRYRDIFAGMSPGEVTFVP